jgi:hypothetical protein
MLWNIRTTLSVVFTSAKILFIIVSPASWVVRSISATASLTNTGGVGTALLGPSPDGTCRAVFVVVTANGAIVQEHTLYGLDGLAPPGTVRPILGRDGNAQQEAIEPRFGVVMNPYNLPKGVVRQLFVTEPFYDTIALSI